jgi:iron complex outermembrane recepter protein
MFAQRSAAAKRSLLFVNTLLLSTAIALPALAQIEEVVVTAQRKAEDIQSVPIQVTAFSSEDLLAHQITMAKDLQFATPNVTYTKTNFSGDDFTIRGIGNDVITGGGESAVSVSFDNIYLAGAIQNLSSYYDVDRVEVLEGPQSTLYGRGAAAGSVNIIPKKPDLENFQVEGDASYGNYNANEDRIAINIPIVTDQLGVRFAFDREYNNGTVTNVYDDGHINSNNTYSVRGSLRWEPTDNTIVDVVMQAFHKDDSSMRAQRQQCLYDPSGTLGCLAGGLANQSINENAFFSADLVSVQGLNAAGLPGDYLGLSNLQVAAPELTNPSNPFSVNTDFTPTWKADDNFLALNWVQHIAHWLDFEANAGYDHGSSLSQESYNNTAAPAVNPPFNVGGSLGNFCEAAPIAGLPCNNGLGTYGPGPFGYAVENSLYELLSNPTYGGPAASPAYAAQFAQYFNHPGLLPVSGFTGLGLSTDTVKYYTDTYSTFDQSNAEQAQYSIDARFTSRLDGPFNFMVGGFYLRQQGWGDYYVSSGAQGYASVALGAISGLLGGPGHTPLPFCYPTPGCTYATAYYDNSAPNPDGVTLKSKSLYGEVYYNFLPDLKLTIGGRWTDDYKSQLDNITLINAIVPIGQTNIQTYCTLEGAPCNYQFQSQNYINYTGRAVLDWTPELDFTDRTLIYGSLSRGYKAGGFNPGLTSYAESQGVSSTYRPEGIDAIELGTKNMVLGSTLQINADIWYYNYEGLQVSQILDNDSINVNVNSRMYGSEGNFVYAPDEHWAFNFNVGYTHSALGNESFVDPRNPTAGLASAVLIKDATPTATAAQNCSVFLINGQNKAPGDNTALTLALAGAGMANPYFAPAGGSTSLAAYGIPLTNYGSCNPTETVLNPAFVAIMNANGYAFSQPGTENTSAGVPQSIHGNENPNTPPVTLSFGAQYTAKLGSGYTLVPRVDFYFQTQMWGRIFEDPADKISSYTITNAQIQLNSPDSDWYVQAFIKNAFNKTYVTGEYLTSSSSGLYTNEFLGDPRMYGIRVGINF